MDYNNLLRIFKNKLLSLLLLVMINFCGHSSDQFMQTDPESYQLLPLTQPIIVNSTEVVQSNPLIGLGNFITGITGAAGVTLEFATTKSKFTKGIELLASLGWSSSGFLEIFPVIKQQIHKMLPQYISLTDTGPWLSINIFGQRLKLTAYHCAIVAAFGYSLVYSATGDYVSFPAGIGWLIGAGLEAIFNQIPSMADKTDLPMLIVAIPCSTLELLANFIFPGASWLSILSNTLCVACACAEVGSYWYSRFFS